MTTKIDKIPTAEIEQDIKDTQSEIDDFIAEKDILMKKPTENKVRIYILQGRISTHKAFIEKLEEILKERGEDSGKT